MLKVYCNICKRTWQSADLSRRLSVNLVATIEFILVLKLLTEFIEAVHS